MSKLVPPHGSDTLIPLLAPEAELAEELKRAGRLRKVPMSSRETSDFIMLAMGAYTPLRGFMGKADWHGVCANMKLANGLFWPIPITLSCSRELADSIATEDTVALVDQDSGRDHGHARSFRKIPAQQRRQRVRVPAHLPHHRPEAPRRRKSHGAGRGQSRGPRHCAERRHLSQAI